MIKRIIEAPFHLIGWLFKDTYGRVMSVVLLTIIVCLVNYPIQDVRVGVWEVEDTLKEEYSIEKTPGVSDKARERSDVDSESGAIDRNAIESRKSIRRVELFKPWALITMPFHHISEQQHGEVIEERWNESRRNRIKRRQVVRVSRGLTLGLDLRGGIELVYRVITPAGGEAALKAQDIAEVIRRRIDAYGLREPRVQHMGEDRILIQIPGSDASDVSRVRNIITRVGRLEFRIVADKDNKAILEEARKRGQDKPPTGWHWYSRKWRDTKTRKWKSEDLLISDEIGLTGEEIKSVNVGFGGDTGSELAVHLLFKDRDAFWRLTRANVGRRLAILLDDVRSKDGNLFKTGRLHSAPEIKTAIHGSAEISGGFTQKTAEDLKYVLQSGSLKWPLALESERSVGPYQGLRAIQDGKRAVIIGFVAVVGFILIYYLKAGLVADFALLLNLLILVAALSLRSATLTLPGIAGIMLTIGMSIDANVLIFERIREELKKMTDKPLLKCLRDGHRKALVTIVDANLTTLITAVILHMFGTGPVKGFAVTLSYGIVISMFTAVVVTRVIFEALIHARLVTSLRMFEFVKDPRVPFIAMRRVWLTASAVLVVAGLVYFFAGPGKRLGIEFSSGTRVEVNLREQVDAEVVRARVNRAGYDDIEVQEIGPVGAKGSKAFSIRIGYTPRAEVISAAAADPAADPAFAKGAEVVIETNREVDTAEMVRRLAARGSPDCDVKERPASADAFAYAVRNKDAAADPVADLESNVRAVFGSDRITGDIRRAFQEADGKTLLANEGVRVVSKSPLGLNVAIALEKKTTTARLNDALKGLVLRVTPQNEADGKASEFIVSARPGTLTRIKDALKQAELATQEPFASVQKIYPSVARELGARAAVALFLALLATVAYIWFRFEFRFGLAAVIALVHDVALTLGMLALFEYEISLTVIAALLTIVGYSLNDTIVVFDRIRENRKTVRKTPFAEIVNMSINQTLGRTLLTSVTTLLAVSALFIFGGTAIQGFAFTLLWGVIFGTYSSIFIASPVLLMTGEQGALRGPLGGPSARISRPLEGFRSS